MAENRARREVHALLDVVEMADWHGRHHFIIGDYGKLVLLSFALPTYIISKIYRKVKFCINLHAMLRKSFHQQYPAVRSKYPYPGPD